MQSQGTPAPSPWSEVAEKIEAMARSLIERKEQSRIELEPFQRGI